MSYPMADPPARCADVQPILDWLLQRGTDLSQTAFGNVQVMSWTAGYLEIKAQRGFDAAFLRFFGRVTIEDGSACARALRNREPIIIEDIMADEEFLPCRKIVRDAGIRAVQSTPIISSSGALLGIVSTHFAVRHRPTRIELLELQNAAQTAANALIRVEARRCSIRERVNNSLRLLERSGEAMARADRLLLTTQELLRRRPVA